MDQPTANSQSLATAAPVPPVDLTPTGKVPALLGGIPAQPKPQQPAYTPHQLAGEECALCGIDLAYATAQQPHGVTADGHHLNACAPTCAPKNIRIEAADLDDGIALIFKEYGQTIRIAYDPRHITVERALSMTRHYIAQGTA
ncbi:hypothetical protein ACFU51_01315 [Streptomyces sp. NPDC057430]|uniref:hypothetical protein n=1 Tax=Streptomyces sp. NPDC057430 TaxID=3346131 RepID=UPI00367EEC12